MNRKIGMGASLVTLASVIAFALFMLFGMSSASYAACIFLACGYITMACAWGSYAAAHTQAAKGAGTAFAVIYGVFVLLVYYAQVTTLRQYPLSGEAAYLLDYQSFGLFFAYDLFGYGMLAVSTFFIGLTIAPADKGTKALKYLMLVHGIFCVVCFLPALGVFQPGMPNGDFIGIAVLEVWCVYFIPICILSLRFFHKQAQ